jgi:hypothetical protein
VLHIVSAAFDFGVLTLQPNLLHLCADIFCLHAVCLLFLQPGDNVLKQQLQQLQEKGPSAWQVYYDETVAGKPASGGKAPQALYDSWDDFEEHVVHTHLVRWHEPSRYRSTEVQRSEQGQQCD